MAVFYANIMGTAEKNADWFNIYAVLGHALVLSADQVWIVLWTFIDESFELRRRIIVEFVSFTATRRIENAD